MADSSGGRIQGEVPVIVVGAGITGLVIAAEVLEQGGRVVLLERAARWGHVSAGHGGGINAAGSRLQASLGCVSDSPDLLFEDIGRAGKVPEEGRELARRLCRESPDAVEWLAERFGLRLPRLARLRGHRVARTHWEAGADLASALAQALRGTVQAAAATPGRARIVTGARVTQLLAAPDGSCAGCVYLRGADVVEERGVVVLATGGFGGSLSDASLLARHRPDLLHLPTACSKHQAGDGIRLGEAMGARTLDMEWVHVHPAGLVSESVPQGRTRRVAPELLQGAGGVLVNAAGDRLCDEEAADDAVCAEMWLQAGPVRWVITIGAADAAGVRDLCVDLMAQGLMKEYADSTALAADIGVPVSKVEASLSLAPPRTVKGEDAGELRHHDGPPPVREQRLFVAVVTPVVLRSLGGLQIDADCAVLNRERHAIRGLYAAGGVVGGLRSARCLGGNRLLEALVFGRAAARASAEHAKAEGSRPPLTPTALARRPEVGLVEADEEEARCGAAEGGAAGRPAPPGTGIGMRARVAARQLERHLERHLTAAKLQACLAKAHPLGDLGAAARELCDQLLRADDAPASTGPVLRVAPRDLAQRGDQAAAVGTFRAALPGGRIAATSALVPCRFCRLPVVFEVCQCDPAGAPVPAAAAARLDRFAYATLLYGDRAEYLLGALVLGWSLRATGSTLDRLLLHTADVPEGFLKLLRHFWTLRPVGYLKGSEKLYRNFRASRFQAVFTKLQALSCTDYTKVLMLDLDMLVRWSIDELFELPAPAALKRASGRDQPAHGGAFTAEDLWHDRRDDMCSGINAGVMLLAPDQKVYERMVAEIADDGHPEHIGTFGPEQDYLSRFYCTFFTGKWAHIHAKFNYQPMLPDGYVSQAHRQLDVQRDVVVAHYSGPRVKPWEMPKGQGGGGANGLGSREVKRLLEDDTLREREPRRGGGGGAARERIMDGVLIVEEAGDNGSLPVAVQEIMWEWVIALRAACAHLHDAGEDVLGTIRAVEAGGGEAPGAADGGEVPANAVEAGGGEANARR